MKEFDIEENKKEVYKAYDAILQSLKNMDKSIKHMKNILRS